jgi:hypothetical protein
MNDPTISVTGGETPYLGNVTVDSGYPRAVCETNPKIVVKPVVRSSEAPGRLTGQ